MSYKSAKAWVDKKLAHGVNERELYHCVGKFSNRPRGEVMKEKGLTAKQYEKRYNFMLDVFQVLEDK